MEHLIDKKPEEWKSVKGIEKKYRLGKIKALPNGGAFLLPMQAQGLWLKIFVCSIHGMFHHLRGPISVIDASFAVLDVSGVGYTVHATNTTLGALTLGQETQLFTHLHIRENAWDVFGFATTDERTSFLKLIDVNGVGPKAALAILSVMNPMQLAQAVALDDPAPVTQASGVGKKLAERIVRELKGKLDTTNIAILPQTGSAANTPSPENAVAMDVLSALINLGWKEHDGRSVLKDIEVTDFDATLKAALAYKHSA